MLAVLVVVIVVATATRAQVTKFLGASIERVCVRRGADIIPANGTFTVDGNCTATRYVVTLRIRATASTGQGLIVEGFLDDGRLGPLFNQSGTDDPTLPPVIGLQPTRFTVEMSEVLHVYPTYPLFTIPERYGAKTRNFVSFGSGGRPPVRNCEGISVRRSADPMSDECYESNSGTSVGCRPAAMGGNANCPTFPQSGLEEGMRECWEVRCYECTTGVSSVGRRRLANYDRMWWEGRLFLLLQPTEPYDEYTITTRIIAPDGEEMKVILGASVGKIDAPNSIDAPGNIDPLDGSVFAPPPEQFPGRQFSTSGYSPDPNKTVRVLLETVSSQGTKDSLSHLTLAALSLPGEKGYDEGPRNPRQNDNTTCAVFDDVNNSTSSAILCALPNTWFVAINGEDEFLVGRNCCNCFGVTQQSLYSNPNTRKLICNSEQARCIPGVDITSADTSQGPRFFLNRQLRFRRRQFDILCYGEVTSPESKLTYTPGDYSTAPGPEQCTWHLPSTDRAQRLENVALQPAFNMPPSYDQTGRSNMWTSQGRIIQTAPTNYQLSVTQLIQFDGAFGGVIVRQPTVVILPITSGTPCSVTINQGGTIRGRLVNLSSFGGQFNLELTCPPPYLVIGAKSVGIGLDPAPFEFEFSFEITVVALETQANTGCTFRLLSFDFAPLVPDQVLPVTCRQEDKAFSGPAGSTSDPGLNQCAGDVLCELSNVAKVIIIILAIVLIILVSFGVIRKFILKS